MTLRLVEPVLSGPDTERTLTNGEIAGSIWEGVTRLYFNEPERLPTGVARHILYRLFLAVSENIRASGYAAISLTTREVIEYSQVVADACRCAPWSTEESVRTKWEEIERSMPIVTPGNGQTEVRLFTELERKLRGNAQRIRVAVEVWRPDESGGMVHEQPVSNVEAKPFTAADLEHLFDRIAAETLFADRAVIHSGREAIIAAIHGTPVQVLVGRRYSFGAATETLMLEWGDGTGQHAVKKGGKITHVFNAVGVVQPKIHRKGAGWVALPIRIEVVTSMTEKARALRNVLSFER